MNHEIFHHHHQNFPSLIIMQMSTWHNEEGVKRERESGFNEILSPRFKFFPFQLQRDRESESTWTLQNTLIYRTFLMRKSLIVLLSHSSCLKQNHQINTHPPIVCVHYCTLYFCLFPVLLLPPRIPTPNNPLNKLYTTTTQHTVNS